MTATIINDEHLEAYIAQDGAPLGTYLDPARRRDTPPGGDWLVGWHYTVTGEGRHVCDGGGRIVAHIVGGTDWREADRIGDLMASGGELATALRELCAVIEGTYLPPERPLGLTAALLGARVALEGANAE